MDKGLIQVYYGDGKGKTTAALGQALRCAGRDYKVLYTAFLKNKDSGEFMVDLPFEVMMPEYNCGFWHSLDNNEKACAKECAENVIKNIKSNFNKYDMVVLDELLDAVMLGCIEKNLALEFINSKPKATHLVITGHCYDQEIFEIADCITEMKKIKHHYDKGVKCREGIEK